MKKLIMTMCTAFFLGGMNAQVMECTTGMTVVENDTLECVNVKMDPPADKVKDKFEDWMDDTYDVDLDSKKFVFFEDDVLSAKGVRIPEISDRKIDLYVKVDNIEGTSDMCVYASYGYDNYITSESDPIAFNALRDITYTFVETYLPAYYEKMIEERNENIEEIVEDREELQEKLQENQKKIIKLRKENEEIKKKLELKLTDLRYEEMQLKKKKSDYNKVKSELENSEG